MRHEFTLVSERGDDDWWIATVAEYPGAFSQGKTIDEARDNAMDALVEIDNKLVRKICAQSAALIFRSARQNLHSMSGPNPIFPVPLRYSTAASH